MLHGWGKSSKDLKPLGELLEGEVLALDLPGFGEEAIVDPEWGPFEYGRWVVSQLDKRGIDRAILLGHSFGGKVACCVAAQDPSRVSKLILMGASALRAKRSWLQSMRFFWIRSLSKLLKRCAPNVFRTWFVPRFGSKDYQQAGPLRKTLVKAVNLDLTDALRMIDTPAHLIWGENDLETPVEIGHRMCKLMRRATLQVLPNKGHEPYKGVGAHLIATLIRTTPCS